MKAYRWAKPKRGRRVRCARGSMRTIHVGKSRSKRALRICCPAGKWMPRKKRCKVGTRAYEIGTPL